MNAILQQIKTNLAAQESGEGGIDIQANCPLCDDGSNSQSLAIIGSLETGIRFSCQNCRSDSEAIQAELGIPNGCESPAALSGELDSMLNSGSSKPSTLTKPPESPENQRFRRQGREENRIQPFQPFPTEALPQPIGTFVESASKAIGCDSSFVALPLLSVLAAAIGNTRRIQLKRGWFAPPIIWTAVVGESGTMKTPAFQLVMKPIENRQRQALEQNAEAMKGFEDEMARYEKHLAEWKKDKKNDGEPPRKPMRPKAARCLVKDTTVEALAPILMDNPRGVLLCRDELAGWIGSFDKYSKGGKGGNADAAHWLSMFNGDSITVDRKTGEPRTIYVPQAFTTVTGGIQPGVLNRALGTEHRESGLAARLLLAWPPRKPRRWTEAEIHPSDESSLADLVGKLFELEPTEDDDGNPRPVIVKLDADAKQAFKDYVNAHGQEQVKLEGDLAAAWSKLEETPARLALVIHMVRCADSVPFDSISPDRIDGESMKAAIRLAEWFKAETKQVYTLLAEPDEAREQRKLVEWIESKGGTITARELQQAFRKYRQAIDAEADLNELAKLGFGEWFEIQPGPDGGRPTREFRLFPPAPSTKPSETRENRGFVYVDSVDTPENQSDEWGEL